MSGRGRPARLGRTAARTGAVAVAALIGLIGLVACGVPGRATGDRAEDDGIRLPPAHAGFDYQIGGAYPPPDGVLVLGRDHADEPAPGLYNICYVNAFQAQPGTEEEWGELLLRDEDGEIVYDEDWGEALLDLRTADKREAIAERVGRWIDDCAERGFRAVEPDNLDSFGRSQGLLTAEHAQRHVRLISEHAHRRGLAVAQKNTVELADAHQANGMDFAVAEECGQYEECGGYVDAFGDHVLVIEYTDEGFAAACDEWGDRLGIVRRDRNVSTPGDDGYVYRTCPE